MASCARTILFFGRQCQINATFITIRGAPVQSFNKLSPRAFSNLPEIQERPEKPKNVFKSEQTLQLPASVIDESLQHEDYFGVRKLFTVRDLFEARVHFGHKHGSMIPHMAPFVFGERLGQLIIDLDQTAYHLRAALNIIAHVTFRQGLVLFVHRNNPANSLAVERAARDCGEFAHTRTWYSDLLTNSTTYFGTVTRLPDLVVMPSTRDTVLEQHPAVIAASKMLIPTVGVVDTDCDPCLVTYPVPGNDDTPCAIELYLKLFSQAVMLGKNKRKMLLQAQVEAGGVTTPPTS